MFLGIVHFYRQFIKGFHKIVALLISVLKTTTLLITKRLGCTKPNKNQLNKNNNDNVSGNKIDKRIANLSNNIKKMSSEVDFPTFKARLTFTSLRKVFIKALILYYYNSEHYI